MKKQKLSVKFKLLHRHFIIFLRSPPPPPPLPPTFLIFRKFSTFQNSWNASQTHTRLPPLILLKTRQLKLIRKRKSKRHEWRKINESEYWNIFCWLVMNVFKVVLSSDGDDDNDENYATKFTVELMSHETNVNCVRITHNYIYISVEHLSGIKFSQ